MIEYDNGINTSFSGPKQFHVHPLSEFPRQVEDMISLHWKINLSLPKTQVKCCPFHHVFISTSGLSSSCCQLLLCWSLSRASNTHSLISSAESSSLNLSNSATDIVFPLIECGLMDLSCLCLLAMDVGEEDLECIGLGVSSPLVGISICNLGLSIDSNSSFIFSMASNSSLTLSLSFLH